MLSSSAGVASHGPSATSVKPSLPETRNTSLKIFQQGRHNAVAGIREEFFFCCGGAYLGCILCMMGCLSSSHFWQHVPHRAARSKTDPGTNDMGGLNCSSRLPCLVTGEISTSRRVCRLASAFALPLFRAVDIPLYL